MRLFLPIIAFILMACALTVPVMAGSGDAAALIEQGMKPFHEGDFDTARKLFDAALAKEPNTLDALLARSALHLDEGEPVDALALLNRADRIAPDNPDVLSGLARGYMAIKVTCKARRLADRAVELAPNAAWPVYVRALVHQRVGLEQEAIRDFTRAMELAPGFVDAYIGRSEVYSAQGHDDLALEDIEAALALLDPLPPLTEE